QGLRILEVIGCQPYAGTVTLPPTLAAPTLACSLTPATVTLPSSSTSSLSCQGQSGVYTVTITGSSGSISHVSAISYTIQDFAVVANPASVTAQAGVSASSPLSVNAQNGYTGTVALTDNVSPSTGLSCSLAPTALSLGNSGSSILSCTGTTGTYTVTVTGTSAS